MFSVTIIVQFPVCHPNCVWKNTILWKQKACDSIIFLNSNAANTWFVSWIERELSHTQVFSWSKGMKIENVGEKCIHTYILMSWEFPFMFGKFASKKFFLNNSLLYILFWLL